MDNPNSDPTEYERSLLERGRELGRKTLALAGVVAALGSPVRALAETASANVTPDAEATALETAARNPEQVILGELRDGTRPNIIWNGAAILPAGTEVHSQPNNSEQSVIGVVRPKTVVLMQNFRIIKGGIKNGALWAAVSPASKSSKPNQATDSRKVSWVNLTRTETRPGFRSLVYKNYNPNDPSSGIPQTIAASIDSRNNLHATGNSDIPAKQLSTMTVLPARTVPNVLRTRGMVRARIKPRFILPPQTEQPQPLPNLPDIVPQPQGPIGGNVSPTPEVPPDAGPKRPNELPGFRDSEVSPEIESSFNRSIVRVLIRRKGDGNWTDWCQGTKIDGEVFFAAHCEPTIGAPAHGDMPVGPNGIEAFDYANASEFEFTSVDPNLPDDIKLRADMQTAKEEGLVMPTGNDVAVLKLQPIANPTFDAWQQQVGNQDYRSYGQISSMPFKVPASTPTLGTQVYFNGASQYNGYRLLNNTVKQGISIGEWTNFSTWDIPQPRNMYVVATNPLSEAEDGGGFGTSGESAVTSKGELLISNSVRASYGYLNGPPNARESQDFFQRVVTEYGTRGILLGKEQGSSTVLFFTKVTNDLKQKIDAAFGHAPPA